ALRAARGRRGRARVGAAADRGAGCGPPAGDGGSGRRGRGRADGRARVRPVRMRPTAALARAAIVGCGAFALAVLLGRPALVLVGLPLMAWALMAVAARVGRGAERDIQPPALLTGGRTVEEAGSTSVGLRGPPGLLTAASVPLLPHTVLAPRHGALAADGELRIRVDARRWGRIRLGPVHTVVADGLGAFRAQLTLPPVDLHAVPASSVLDAPVEVPTPIGVSGVHLSRRRGDGTALSEVREFRPGDRLHRINWRVTNRTGALHTNATFTEQDTDVLIVTDTIADIVPAPWAGTDAPTSLDLSVRATAAVARHYLGAGDRVSLFDIGHLIGPVRAGTGPRQLRRARRLRSVRPGTLPVVCSPLLSKDAIAQIGVLVAHGADVIVVDTLPPSIGDISALTGRAPRMDGRVSDRFWPEAWALRRLQRERTVRELRESGVPVTAWEGPASL